MLHNMSNVSTANIAILNTHFQDFIQFFILILTVSSIVFAYDSLVFTHWVDKIKKDYGMAPTKGFFILYSLFATSLCLVGSCISILVLFGDFSDSTLTIVNKTSNFLWVLLSAAVIIMLIDVIHLVRFLLPGSNCYY